MQSLQVNVHFTLLKGAICTDGLFGCVHSVAEVSRSNGSPTAQVYSTAPCCLARWHSPTCLCIQHSRWRTPLQHPPLCLLQVMTNCLQGTERQGLMLLCVTTTGRQLYTWQRPRASLLW